MFPIMQAFLFSLSLSLPNWVYRCRKGRTERERGQNCKSLRTPKLPLFAYLKARAFGLGYCVQHAEPRVWSLQWPWSQAGRESILSPPSWKLLRRGVCFLKVVLLSGFHGSAEQRDFGGIAAVSPELSRTLPSLPCAPSWSLSRVQKEWGDIL